MRFNNSDYTYTDLELDIQQSLYWSTGADTLVIPTVTEGENFYIAFYQAYSNGLTYFSPGTYSESLFAPTLPSRTYPECSVSPQNIGYDGRCRPWYISQM